MMVCARPSTMQTGTETPGTPGAAANSEVSVTDCRCLNAWTTDKELQEHIFSCPAYEQGLVLFSEVEEEEFRKGLQDPQLIKLFAQYVAARKDNLNVSDAYAVALEQLNKAEAADAPASAEPAKSVVAPAQVKDDKKDAPVKPEVVQAPEKAEVSRAPVKTEPPRFEHSLFDSRPEKKQKMTQMTLEEYTNFSKANPREAKPLVRPIVAPVQKPVVNRPLVTMDNICNSMALYFSYLHKPNDYAKFIESITKEIEGEIARNPNFPKPQKSENEADEKKMLWKEADVLAVREFMETLPEVAEVLQEQGYFRIEVGDFGLHACFNYSPVELPTAHPTILRLITFDVNGSHVQLFDSKATDSKTSYASFGQRISEMPYGQIFMIGGQMNRESVASFKQYVQHHLCDCGHVSGNFVDLGSGGRMALYGVRGGRPRSAQIQCRPQGVYIYRKPNDLSSILDGPLAKRDGNCPMCRVHRGCGVRKGVRDESIFIPEGPISWDFMFECFEKVGFPHCDSRKNVMSTGLSFLECFCLGIVNCYSRGPVMSSMTSKMNNFTTLITQKFHRDAPYMDLKEQMHPFTVIQVNRSVRCKMHVDGNNVGPSYICGFGDYSGGETWIMDGVGPVEMVVEDNLRGYDIPIGTVLKGTCHDIKNKWVYFNGRIPHCTMPFQGKRYALVFFVHNCTGRLKNDEMKEQMKELGFCLPASFDFSKVSEDDCKVFDANPDLEDDHAAEEEAPTSVVEIVETAEDAVEVDSGPSVNGDVPEEIEEAGPTTTTMPKIPEGDEISVAAGVGPAIETINVDADVEIKETIDVETKKSTDVEMKEMVDVKIKGSADAEIKEMAYVEIKEAADADNMEVEKENDPNASS